MNKHEWRVYEQTLRDEPSMLARDFEALRPVATEGEILLCRGYHHNRLGIEVWLSRDGMIGRRLDDGPIDYRPFWKCEALCPRWRAYREDTEFQFAVLMKERYMPLPFTSWRS